MPQSFSIKELKEITSPFKQKGGQLVLPEQKKPPYQNILANITPDDAYQAIASSLLSEVSQHLPKDTAEKVLARSDISEPIVGDTFYSMYSYMPMLKSSSEITNEIMKQMRDLFEKFMSSTKYKALRSVTKLDRIASKIFATRFARTFLEELAKMIPPEQWPQNQGQQPQPQAGGSSGQQKQQQKQGKGKGKGKSNNKQNKNKKGKNKSEGQGQKQQEQKWKEQMKQAVQQAFKKALKDAEKAAKNYQAMESLTAGKEAGELAFLDEDPTIEQVEFEEMVKILGTLRKAMPIMFSKAKKPSIMGDTEGYTITHNPAKALPREIALPKDLFMLKLTRGGFLAKEKRLPEKGVMIVLLDKSGSMGTQKMAWAKAVALALALKARKEKLDYYLVPFDGMTYEPLSLSNLPSLKTILRIRSSGGTRIARALRTAMDLASEKNYHKANIVMITDGADDIREEYRDLMEGLKKMHASLKVIYIKGYNELLDSLAQETGGQLLSVEPSSETALRVVKKA